MFYKTVQRYKNSISHKFILSKHYISHKFTLPKYSIPPKL